MFFNRVPLRNKIIKMIVNNPVPYRNTDISSLFLILSITLFFNKYKSVIINELYYKDLIKLHGDVELFIKAKSAKDTRYLRIAASITPKGLCYYKAYILEIEQETEAREIALPAEQQLEVQSRPERTLSIVR